MRLHHELHILLASRLLCPRHFQYLLNHGSNDLTLYTITTSDDIEIIEQKENYRKKKLKNKIKECHPFLVIWPSTKPQAV